MKFGIITLVSDNYGNKYQNYAVEQILSEYGSVETFGLEELYKKPKLAHPSIIQKLNPRYFREVLISRLMYRYDINRIDKGVLYNLFYVKRHARELLALKDLRRERFETFSKRVLHICDKRLNKECSGKEWSTQFDCFICGSDQIWNPDYATTSELAFCSFAPEKTICFSPSFGVSEIPEYRKKDYANWLSRIYTLSVRENDGKRIIKNLTGREAIVLLDPTMVVPVEKWDALCKRPKNTMPEKYIACYFLGKVDKTYKNKIDDFSAKKSLPVVMLFDITTPQYYTYDPAEVLFTIKNAEYVLTDSFHGCVFSVLYHKEFIIYERNEGGTSMNSRLETLLTKFGLEDRYSEKNGRICEERWDEVERLLKAERKKTFEYLTDAIGKV